MNGAGLPLPFRAQVENGEPPFDQSIGYAGASFAPIGTKTTSGTATGTPVVFSCHEPCSEKNRPPWNADGNAYVAPLGGA